MIKSLLKRILCVERWRYHKVFFSDETTFWNGTHLPVVNLSTQMEARITMRYHVIEKGLTMPNRRLAFGKPMLISLIEHTEKALKVFGKHTATIDHAIGIVKVYLELHKKNGCDFSSDSDFWRRVNEFLAKYPNIKPATQPVKTYIEFYQNRESPFPAFAASRHTVRHYTDKVVPITLIKEAVRLAMTTPSACNRQHARVHCIASREIAHRILKIQGGNRGFGHLADKAIIITSDLSVEMTAEDNFDPFVNGGMFLMNLCYALHYYCIAHCILTCSIPREKIKQIKELAHIPSNEVVVAMLSCGFAPDSFEIAASPRKLPEEILSIVE